ncbi:MAG: peptidylprolyl isomerase [Halobacteriovoraceae bacterium]|nr:peptidylprolyl isomerase [Halobacteriovoraceae bacterium]
MKLLRLTIFLIMTSSMFSLADENKVVAEVNGKKITQYELDEAYKQRLLYPTHQKVTKQSVLDELIDRRVGVDKAREEKLQNDPYVTKLIEDVLHNALISKDLQEKFSAIRVTESEVKSYYKNNKEYRTSHILFRLRAIPSKEEVSSGLKFMTSLYAQLKKEPSQFEDLATKHSQIGTNQSGGDIGYLPPTSMAPEYYAAIEGKPVGHITAPVRTQFGFHIIKVTGVKDYKDIDVNLYRRIIFDMKRDKILDDYYAGLRKSAKIKIFKENL